MADTVKKSRIVSEPECFNNTFEQLTTQQQDNDDDDDDDDDETTTTTTTTTSLQDIINTEFNERLKSCMATNNTPLDDPPDLITNNIIVEAGHETNENNEKQNNITIEVTDDENVDEIEVKIVDDDVLTAKERFLSSSSIDVDDDDDDDGKQQTIKDRMFLSTLDSTCLLFTQTVVQSPMLTPTDEDYDFLRALKPQQQEQQQQREEDDDVEFLVIENDSSEQDDITANEKSDDDEMEQIAEIKKDIQEFVEQEYLVKTNDATNTLFVDLCDSTTVTTSESSFVETRTESSNNNNNTGEKIMKKKKSKKSKKDNEKENISVFDLTKNTNNDVDVEVDVEVDDDEIVNDAKEPLTHVSVKNLRAKSMSDIRKEDTSLVDNVFSNVSVKFLRQCFDNLTNKTTNKELNATKIDIKPSIITTSERIKQLKSSFSKFDALSKKTVLHVRSSDAGKAQEKFNGSTHVDVTSCKSCQKQVFQMEQIKAEKSIWHKNCFRCNECNKQLTVDTYQSNEGTLYCKPHFKALFTPKAVDDEPQPVRPRKHEMIIRENQPEELPPDVVRASDKPDLGLEELQNLNVKERFQVFENHHDDSTVERTLTSGVNVKRSPSILSKLAKFQQKGMDVGVSDDSLNGVVLHESSSEVDEDDEDGEDGGLEDPNLIRARRAAAQREIPLHFNNMSEVMSKWESGNQMTKEERREERKQEIQSIRSRLFMGKQGKMKEMYQQAVAESESGINVRKSVPLDTEHCEGAKHLKDKFEKGETTNDDDDQQKQRELEEDKGVFETGISKKSRSIFLELDANASKAPQLAPMSSPHKSGAEVRRAREAFMARQASEDTIRATDHVDDVVVETADITSKFKFFETYTEQQQKEQQLARKQFRITPPRDSQTTKRLSPERDVYRDPDIIRSDDVNEDDAILAKKTHTATKMLNIFRQMEENLQKKDEAWGPKPLKCFTPPPEGIQQTRRNDSGSEEDASSGSEEEYDDDDNDENDGGQKIIDEDLIEAQKAARAKHLRAKFEKWEAHEIQREQNNSSVNLAQEIGEGDSQIESARSLRARFESMRETTTEKERQPRIKVNRFV